MTAFIVVYLSRPLNTVKKKNSFASPTFLSLSLSLIVSFSLPLSLPTNTRYIQLSHRAQHTHTHTRYKIPPHEATPYMPNGAAATT